MRRLAVNGVFEVPSKYTGNTIVGENEITLTDEEVIAETQVSSVRCVGKVLRSPAILKTK